MFIVAIAMYCCDRDHLNNGMSRDEDKPDTRTQLYLIICYFNKACSIGSSSPEALTIRQYTFALRCSRQLPAEHSSHMMK